MHSALMLEILVPDKIHSPDYQNVCLPLSFKGPVVKRGREGRTGERGPGVKRGREGRTGVGSLGSETREGRHSC